MSTVAYSSRVTLHEARWTDNEGSTVTFRLPMDPLAETRRNPFQKFTKRRKGRAGTRFMMACHYLTEDSRTVVYEDEVMLAGWNDSQTTGHTVKLWLCSDKMGHPFEGFTRKVDHFAISLVELDDDQEPIDQKMRDRVERKVPVNERLSYAAAMVCKNPRFWQWCQENGYTLAGNPVIDEESAKLWMYMMCNITTRASLDDRERMDAIEKFQDIRRDFARWDERTGGTPF